MELKWISAFVTLSQYLNFNKAAASMYITQPALSKYIAALEAELGVRLFERSKRAVTLSDAGASFLPQAMNILKVTEDAVAAAKNPSAPKLQGPLRIGIDKHLEYRDCVSCGLPAARETFQARHPKATVEFSLLPFHEIDSRLRSGMLDLGVSILYCGKLHRVQQTSGFSCSLLFRDKMSLVVPPRVRERYDSGVPISEALEGLRLLAMDEDTEFVVERLSSLASVGIAVPVLPCASWNEILARANLGDGFFLISSQSAREARGSLDIITLEELGHDERVFCVALWKDPAPPLLSQFLSLLPDCFE